MKSPKEIADKIEELCNLYYYHMEYGISSVVQGVHAGIS